MQEVGNLRYVGCCALAGSAARYKGTGGQQAEHDAGAVIASAPTAKGATSSTNANPVQTAEFAVNATRDSSSDKLKDALLTSFIDWLSEHVKIVFDAGETPISSGNKSATDIKQEIIAPKIRDSMASLIAANRTMSLLVQANVTQDTALHLLSTGALAETVPEPGQKQQALFEADAMGIRARAKVAQKPF